MATDATATPTTTLGIPKYNTAADIPSGKGFNAAMDFIDDLIEARSTAVPGASGVKVWNNTTKAWETPAGANGTKFLRDDGTFAAPSSGLAHVHAHSTVVQSIANAAGAVVALGGETVDTDNFHDNATNNSRITIPTTGVYRFNWVTSFAANTSGYRQVLVRKNGVTPYVGGHSMDTNSTAGVYGVNWGSILLSLVAADYIELVVVQNSGGALDLQADNSHTTYLEAVKIS